MGPDEGRGQIPHTHSSQAGSPLPLSIGSALMCSPGEGQGSLSWVLQLVSGEGQLPYPPQVVGASGGRSSSLCPLHHMADGAGAWLDFLSLLHP